MRSVGLVLFRMLVMPCHTSGEPRSVTAGEQLDGKFYSWPGFDDPGEAEDMITITRQVTTRHIWEAVPYSQGGAPLLLAGEAWYIPDYMLAWWAICCRIRRRCVA